MNKTLQIFRRLLTFRSCNRIISLGYCDVRSVNNKCDEKETVSPDTSNAADSDSNLEPNQENIRFSSSATQKALSSESIQFFVDEKLSDSTDYVEKPDLGNIHNNSPNAGKERYSDVAKAEIEQEIKSPVDKDENITGSDSGSDSIVGSFLDAFKKHEELMKEPMKPREFEKKETFASLLRNSPFIDIGDPVGKIVLGEIFLVVENDLYIDFGWKFHAVCPKPKKNPESYAAGAKVFLKIKDLELSTRFLGDKKNISLLEADCDIVGIAFSKSKGEKAES